MTKNEEIIAEMEVPEDLQIETLTKEQRWWRNIEDNCAATIKQFKDSIKLQQNIKEMAISKIEELKEE